MIAGSGLASGRHADPALAAAAVREALARAGVTRATRILLFLTRDFAHHAAAAVRDAARAGGTLDVTGCTAHGVLTDRGWAMDQPSAATLVLADLPTPPNPVATPPAGLALQLSGHAHLGPDLAHASRAGLLDGDAVVWQNGRLLPGGDACWPLHGITAEGCHSVGLRPLGPPLSIDEAHGHELCRLAGHPAAFTLRRLLPAECRDPLPLHHLALCRALDQPAIALLDHHADGSLTLTSPVATGESLQPCLRQPLAAEQDMRQTLAAAVDRKKTPKFALMLSCIGRGPLFYGGDDRDLAVLRECFPDLPVAGAYGSGQIVPAVRGSRLFNNSVFTLLCSEPHV